MKLSEREWEVCKCCNTRTKVIQEESFGCDNCGKPIDDLLNNPDNNHRHYLEVSVFHNDAATDHLQFCSWKCVLAKLPKIKSDHFINLPFLTFDNSLEKGIRAQDFFRLIGGRK